MIAELLETTLPIAARIAIRNYCAHTPLDERTWDDFKSKNATSLAITQADFNIGLEIYKNTPLVQSDPSTEPKKNTINNIGTKPHIDLPKKSEPLKKIDDTPKSDDSTIEVDGTILLKKKTFYVSVPYLRSRYNEFNKKYFGNNLPPVNIKLSRSKNALGYYSVSWKRSTHTLISNGLYISNFASFPEKIYCEVLLHEMIHVYQYHVLHCTFTEMKQRGFSHGSTFLNKAREISSHGWNIEVKASSETQQQSTVSKDAISRLENADKIAVYIDDLLCCIPRQAADYYKRCWPNYKLKFYNILDYSPFVLYPQPKKRAYGKVVPKSQIDKYIADGILEPIDRLNESLSNITNRDLLLNNFEDENPLEAQVINFDEDEIECVIA